MDSNNNKYYLILKNLLEIIDLANHLNYIFYLLIYI